MEFFDNTVLGNVIHRARERETNYGARYLRSPDIWPIFARIFASTRESRSSSSNSRKDINYTTTGIARETIIALIARTCLINAKNQAGSRYIMTGHRGHTACVARSRADNNQENERKRKFCTKRACAVTIAREGWLARAVSSSSSSSENRVHEFRRPTERERGRLRDPIAPANEERGISTGRWRQQRGRRPVLSVRGSRGSYTDVSKSIGLTTLSHAFFSLSLSPPARACREEKVCVRVYICAWRRVRRDIYLGRGNIEKWT